MTRVAGQRRQRPLGPADPRQSRRTRQGLTPAMVAALRLAQGGKCALCGRPLGPVVVVDHDHQLGAQHGHNPLTGCPHCCRGLLHTRCNSALGAVFGDDPDKLMSAARYVTRLRRS